jgi:hypothetical protein
MNDMFLYRLAQKRSGGSSGGGAGGGVGGPVVNFVINWDDDRLNGTDGDFATVMAAIEGGKPVYAYLKEISEGTVSRVRGMHLNQVRYSDGQPTSIEFLDLGQYRIGSLNINPEDNYIGENNG